MKGVKERILVLSRESGRDYHIPGLEGGRTCPHLDFHLVDLQTDEIYLYHPPSLLQYAVPSSMVAVDDFIYVFGGTRPIFESESNELNSLQPLYHKEVFFGGARLHLSFDPSKTEDWYPAPVPTVNCNYPRCISLMDKIYVFGSVKLEPEVLDPAVGHWEQLFLPSNLVGCTISSYALPDPSNHRIFLELSGGQLPSPTIYAFTPKDGSSGGHWEPIPFDAQDWTLNPIVGPDWTDVAAVVDNVIYFHSRKFPSILRAFDLASGAWLIVRWESRFDDGVDMNQRKIHFDAMFPLGNKMLCLAVWTQIFDYPHIANTSVKAEIVFRKFRVEQSGATVKLFPLPSRSFILPATSQVVNFLPV
ncbi:uncharacterized protein LOC141598811 [Silene latifolia]|uniref:uncharacterized protein LOC141598811 n=1 Tax=Silene latifolia TaxID=37657 RepID=UPI003D784DF8